MSRTEIKQKKKLVVPFLIMVALTIICVGLLSFVSDKYKEDTSSKIYFLLSTLLLAYILYHPVKKLLKNEPILVFDDESITHYNPKPVTIPKDQIEQTEVKLIDDEGYFLLIKTKQTEYKISISWLDKSPDEVREILKNYKK
ncbi:MAG: hypothetical protein ACK5RG_00815 [Cyclobacteriaceae bacterium]|nr:hypothetical protein [Flammeovirgaceae bacterium]